MSIKFSEIFDERFNADGEEYTFEGNELRCVNDILRFTPDISYSTGNFSMLRDKHAKLQLDSLNGTTERLDAALERTNWPAEFFKDKLILECGCGAGTDTEVLLGLGAKVVSVDLAGLDVCKDNLKNNPNSMLVQASIDNLPFKPKSFDIVWCHRVLQHTPDPKGILDHMLGFVKDDGAVFVHSYGRTLSQMVSWKYAMLPLTRRMNPELLYKLISLWVPPLYYLTCLLRKIPPDLLGKILFRLAKHTLPIRNYRFQPQFSSLDNATMIEYSIHDTFDALCPRYDSPLSAKKFRKIAGTHLKKEFEVYEDKWLTLLRTKV